MINFLWLIFPCFASARFAIHFFFCKWVTKVTQTWCSSPWYITLRKLAWCDHTTCTKHTQTVEKNSQTKNISLLHYQHMDYCNPSSTNNVSECMSSIRWFKFCSTSKVINNKALGTAKTITMMTTWINNDKAPIKGDDVFLLMVNSMIAKKNFESKYLFLLFYV